MSRLALGTAQFGLAYGIANQSGQVNEDEAKSILDLAQKCGIDTLDTAISYGSSEECLGRISLQKFKLITKLPSVPCECSSIKEWVRQQLNESLIRLNSEKVYGLLLHRPQDLLGPNGDVLYEALASLKEIGKVDKIGISIYSPTELETLLPRYKFELIQAPFNLFDRRLVNSGWLYRLKDSDVEVHTRSAFLQGLLLMNRNSMPAKFQNWQQIWDTWFRWLEDHNCSAIEACVKFPLSYSEIDKVVVGVDNFFQLRQLIELSSCTRGDFPSVATTDENLINPSKWLL